MQPSLTEPPAFAQLASHPVRWRLMQELVRSDRSVSELTTLVGEPQSLVSYHLRLLREGGLATVRRSSADRRDSYYSLDLAACRTSWGVAGGALHPALSVSEAPLPCTRLQRTNPRVLFLCTGNSARSQMAEALITAMSSGAVRAASAGSHPKALHPNAVRVLRRRGVDISGNRAKHVDEFVTQRFDTVITLCDRVREVCPEFPSHPALVHWSIPDPAADGAANRASWPAFVRTADELERRIAFQLHQLNEQPTTRRSTHA